MRKQLQEGTNYTTKEPNAIELKAKVLNLDTHFQLVNNRVLNDLSGRTRILHVLVLLETTLFVQGINKGNTAGDKFTGSYSRSGF